MVHSAAISCASARRRLSEKKSCGVASRPGSRSSASRRLIVAAVASRQIEEQFFRELNWDRYTGGTLVDESLQAKLEARMASYAVKFRLLA